jgi:beta-glucanase (GH16 family)
MVRGQRLWWIVVPVVVACASLLAATEKSETKSYRFAAEPAFQDNFDAGWSKDQKDWRVATWKQNGTEMSPERCADDGKGYLVQTVLAGEPYRGGSMQTAKEYPYGRWVARLKPSSVPGVLNSMFTDDWENMTTEEPNDGTKYEVDIEFLTYTFGKKSGKVHLAVHVPGVKNAFVEDVPLKFNPSDDFHVWGIDLLPDRIVWHVDGKELRTWKAPAGQEPPAVGHEMFFNSWTSPKWIKGPPKEDAKYHIDWVRFYPLLTQAADDKAKDNKPKDDKADGKK